MPVFEVNRLRCLAAAVEYAARIEDASGPSGVSAGWRLLESFLEWNMVRWLVVWLVEYTDEFGDWFASVGEVVQDDIDRSVGLLEAKGPHLPFPHSSGLSGARHAHLRELRVQSGGEPYRIFYAFDPRRTAILLIGGNKAGYDRFYDVMIPIADGLYDTYLAELKKEGLLP